MGLLLVSTGIVFIAAASMIAFAALVATLGVRSRESRGTVLLLSWVVPYLLVTGAFQVKFTRYLIPVTPLLALFGAQMLFHLWKWAGDYRRWLRHAVAALMIALVAVTGLYSLAYLGVYQAPHTAVRSSEWIKRNVPEGSVILMEHWEEGIPDLGRYDVPRLPVYENDTPHKLDGMADHLARADYILFYSNRLYGTITRLPERYPVTSAYYRQLFGGELGYRLANVETSYPNLAGVTLVDDTYGRPGLPTPEGQEKPPGLNINLGYADESFSVYDHPKGLVFENVERLDADTIRERILDAAGDDPFGFGETLPRRSRSRLVCLLSEDDLRAQRAGGTWTDIVNPDGIASRMPVLAWLVVMQLMALCSIAYCAGGLPVAAGRGVPPCQAAGRPGRLARCLAMLASLQWMAFSFGSVLVGIGAVAVVSCVVLGFTWSSFWSFFRERWRVIAICEVVFIVAFLAFVVLRMANPDLWHQWQGGEKPMDTAYLNAVLKSSFMPPYDPWYAGGYLNYYYWGQFIVASFIHATGIDTAVAVNLAVPMFFALTVGGAFSVVYNLAESARTKLSRRQAREGPGDVPGKKRNKAFAWSPVLAGVAAALFVTVIGNLDGAIQSIENLWAFIQNEPLRGFDFWRSSRMMPPDPPGNEITEFPFFTFLFADLHAHLMALPFTVLVVGAALAVVLRARSTERGERPTRRNGLGPCRLRAGGGAGE